MDQGDDNDVISGIITKANGGNYHRLSDLDNTHLRSRDFNREITPTPSRSRSRSVPRAKQRSRSSTTGSFINFLSERKPRDPKFSLFKLLMLELNLPSSERTAVSQESFANDSYDQLINLIKIPIVLERFMVLGLLICTTSFLTLFTLVPLRIVAIIFMFIKDLRSPYQSKTKSIESFKFARRDTITILLIVCALVVLSSPALDISKMYHDVKGQAHIKLYVMFGVLEVADKLCSSIGQHILNVTYDLSVHTFTKLTLVRFMTFFGLSTIYLSIHGYILIYQTVSLNVAANSYSNALLTLLFSNQFSELRGSVFKKFDREGLFQLTMADLTERYQLSLMLGMIALRNLLQLNSLSDVLPNWHKWLGVLLGPSIGVLGSEILVDWLKHCYITKFNKIRPRIYNNFIYVLALDYLDVFKSTSVSHHEYELTDYLTLAKRIGLPLLATTVCFLRMSLSDIITIFTVSTSSPIYDILASGLLLVISFIGLLLLRLILGLILLKTTNDIKQKHEKRFEKDIYVNSDPIIPQINEESINGNHQPETISPKSPSDLNFLPGVPNTEMSYIDPQIRSRLYDYGEIVPPSPEEKRNRDFNNKYQLKSDEGLSKVSRYEMTSKRIW